jgi:predicted nucleic acid-binding protein
MAGKKPPQIDVGVDEVYAWLENFNRGVLQTQVVVSQRLNGVFFAEVRVTVLERSSGRTAVWKAEREQCKGVSGNAITAAALRAAVRLSQRYGTATYDELVRLALWDCDLL